MLTIDKIIMKIKCISVKLNEDQLFVLGKYSSAKNHFSISLGEEYVVFGLTFEFNEFGNGCFVQILSNNNHLVHVPITLFDIIDERMSKYWELKKFPGGNIAIWPPTLYKEFYHDDLSEDVPEVVEDFKRIKEQILSEF